MAAIHVPSTIAKKRDGHALTDEEIRDFVGRYAEGKIPDEQMAAMAMAIYFQDLDPRETATWTDAVLRSGEILSFQHLGRPVVDKHSTGGVGDKVSIVLAPLVAACGLTVPMISGRGLGHTGGTLDKLESIPNFEVDLSPERFEAILRDIGCVIASATDGIAPADKRIYALRDVTATVSSIPLIVASIMGKKLAEGPDALVLDVKVGRAAFMQTLEEAQDLADRMISVGKQMDVRVAALISRMDEPLGAMIGNATEIHECLDILRGDGPGPLRSLILEQAALMLSLGLRIGISDGRQMALKALQSGAALATFEKMVAAQGGDLSALPPLSAPIVVEATEEGYVQSIDALAIAKALVPLGAGREQKGDLIDHAVGVELLIEVGDPVVPELPIAHIYRGKKEIPETLYSQLREAIVLGPKKKRREGLIVELRN